VKRIAAILALLAPLSGCASGPPALPRPRPEAYPGELLDSSGLPDGLFLRQRIGATFGEHEVSFEAVLQTDGGVLSLVALTPYGTRAFLIEQRGVDVKFTKFVDRELPFPPRFILLDVHRTLFLRLSRTALADGLHVAERLDERIVERWHGGRLHERTFVRLDEKPTGTIRIVYHGGMLPGFTPPIRVELNNGWFGYRLWIETLQAE
jgi:hypothetical protein